MREPAVAGTFYNADPAILARSVDDLIRDAAPGPKGTRPKALIIPHAGHVYSGPIAATAYKRLVPMAGDIRRVVLLGPSHRVSFKGIAASTATRYRTPLGDIPVDTRAVRAVTKLSGVGFLDQAHAQEHSLEVHLPFLQRVLGNFELVPLVVGDATREEVAAVIDTLWGGDETVILISSDLSHYHDYNAASHLDQTTANKIVALDDTLVGEEACGCRPINGLLHLAREKGFSVRQLDVRNSGDTAGDHGRVVGYGAFELNETAMEIEAPMSLAHRQRLLQVAREAILKPLTSKEPYNIDLAHYPALFREERATFVTLNLGGQLRGCIGSLVPQRALVIDVASNAQSAAFKDPRFAALTLDEYQDVDIHISVLTQAREMQIDGRADLVAQLRPGIDGLILEAAGKRATYLPSVWSQLPEPERFVSELRRKAGLDPNDWSADTRAFRYQTEEFA